jgi:hypothetical protein
MHRNRAGRRVGERHERGLDGGAYGSPAGVLYRPRAAGRADQPAHRVGQAAVPPDALDLAGCLLAQAGRGQRRRQVVPGQCVRRVAGPPLRWAQRGHGQVHGGRFGPLRGGEVADRDQPAGPADPGRLGQRCRWVSGELDCVDTVTTSNSASPSGSADAAGPPSAGRAAPPSWVAQVFEKVFEIT